MSKKTVAIVGSHPVTRGKAPWTKKYVDIWVFNEAGSNEWVKRVDAVFQIHLPPIWKNPNNKNDPGHYEWLKQQHPFPVYMQDEYPDVPSSVKYPLEDVIQQLLPNLRRRGAKRKEEIVKYFSSSPAYAIALALCQGYERIELYGVEMATVTEYQTQRSGVALWLGIAVGRGVEVILPEESGLLKGLLYGYEGDVVIHRQEFETTAVKLNNELVNAQAHMGKTGARLENVLRLIARATTDEESATHQQEYLEAMKAHNNAILRYGVISGALQENERYLRLVDEMIAAAGGTKAVDAMLPEAMKLATNYAQ